jgi:hypothetical protein
MNMNRRDKLGISNEPIPASVMNKEMACCSIRDDPSQGTVWAVIIVFGTVIATVVPWVVGMVTLCSLALRLV